MSAVMGERLAAGESLVLFAEGTTGDGTRILPLKSSLIGAVHHALGADNAEITVWPLSIAYIGRRGIPGGRFGRAHLAWYGDTELMPHLVDILNGGPLDVILSWGEPIRMGHAVSRKEAARLAEKSLKQALALAVTGRGCD
jgi:lyso-ornithine lipid O-acyltransferase